MAVGVILPSITIERLNDMKKINQVGFATVELLVALVLVIAVGATAWYVGKNSSNSHPDYVSSSVGQNTISNAKHKAPVGWKTFVDKHGQLSFDYPSDWKLNIKNSDAFKMDTRGNFLTGSVDSPNGKVKLEYQNYQAGVGQVDCDLPDTYPCPVIEVFNVDDLPNIKDPSFKYIEKIVQWNNNGDQYVPAFGLDTFESQAPVKVGTITHQNDFFLAAGFTNEGGYFAYNWTAGAGPKQGFKTHKEARDFLDSDDAKTAKQILLSVRKV